MSEHIDQGAHEIAWTGTTATTGESAPGFGTWEVVQHAGCAGNGTLRQLGRGETVPPCPVCSAEVTWQLTHLASTVAADHRGVGRLP